MFFTRNVADARKRLDGLKNQQLRSRQVVLYKTPEAAALVPEMLSLPVAFDGSGVSLAIALLVTGMLVSPLLAALAHDLGVEGIGTNFPLVIIPSPLTLAGGLAANLLLGLVRGRLKNLLAIRTTSETHQDGSGSECHSLILSRSRV